MKNQSRKSSPGKSRQLLRSAVIVSTLVMPPALLTACIPAALGVITVTAIDLANERRTMGTVIDDNLVGFNINQEILNDPSLKTGARIKVTALNAVVLLTGQVASDTQKAHVEHLANSYQKVSQVVNQLEIAAISSLSVRANDTLITAKVKTELLRNSAVDSTNIKVITARGVVYLLGIVSSLEGEAAVEATKNVHGIARIVKVFLPPS